MYDEDHKNVFICSRHNEVFLFILKYLHCSLSFLNSGNNFGGRLQPNGSWNGVLSLLNSSLVDFVPHVFSLTNHREEVIYYQRLLPATEQICIISYPRAVRQQSPVILLSVFTATIWLLIGLSYLLYSILNWLSLELEKRFTSDKENHHYQFDRLVLSHLKLFAILLGQGTVKKVSSSRYLLLWIAFALVMRTLFANDLTATLLSRRNFIFDTFMQLSDSLQSSRNNNLRILILGKSTGYYFLVDNFPRLHEQLEAITFEENTAIGTLKKVVTGSAVLVTTRAFGDMIKDYYTTIPFHVSKEGFFYTIGNFPIRHGLDKANKNRLSRLYVLKTKNC